MVEKKDITHHMATSLAMMALLKAIVIATGVASRLEVRRQRALDDASHCV